MDKHTRRYLYEKHGICTEHLDLGEIMDCIKQGGDSGYLSNAIEDQFQGVEKDFLKMKLLEEMYKRRG